MHLIRRASAVPATAGCRLPASALLLLPAVARSVALRRVAVAAALPRQTRRGLASDAKGDPVEPGIPAEPGIAAKASPFPIKRVVTDRKGPSTAATGAMSPAPASKTRRTTSPRGGGPRAGDAPARPKRKTQWNLQPIDHWAKLRFALREGQRAVDAAAAGDGPAAAAVAPPPASAATLQGRLTDAAYDAATGLVRLTYDGLVGPMHTSTLWLRDRCGCGRCVTPSSGQKQFQTSALPAFPGIERVEVVEGGEGETETALRVVWDGEHIATFPGQALLLELAHLDAPATPALPPRRLWDRALLEQALRPVAYDAWMADGAAFDRALLDLYQLGLVVVEGVPETVASGQPGVRAVAERIGNIQNTFYGETFDVVSKPAAENVAYTSEFLCLHQDLLYMNDPPYIQLLHCLRNDSAGGESLFSDSVAAAVHLQRHLDPQLVAALAAYPVRYHYERNGHFYFGARPLLELADTRPDRATDAVVKHTAWSPPFQQPFAGRPVRPVAASDHNDHNDDPRRRTDLHRWHAGAAAFQQHVEHPDNLFEMRLRPGQCVLFNNRRILHGRRQFAPATGARHLQGTYIDEQTFTSRIIGLVRDGRVPPAAWGPAAHGHTTRQRPLPPLAREIADDEVAQVAALQAAQAARAKPE